MSFTSRNATRFSQGRSRKEPPLPLKGEDESLRSIPRAFSIKRLRLQGDKSLLNLIPVEDRTIIPLSIPCRLSVLSKEEKIIFDRSQSLSKEAGNSAPRDDNRGGSQPAEDASPLKHEDLIGRK